MKTTFKPRRTARLLSLLGALAAVVVATRPLPAAPADEKLHDEAAAALRRAVGFFREHVACEGGYLWRYSEDLRLREGEGKAAATTVWVQPPGTPSVGLAMLRAYQATGDRYYLDGARQAGYCLVRGQLRSGGWDYRIEFDPKARSRYDYRADPPAEGKSARNVSTLDDNTTQEALRLLMRLDRALDMRDAEIHEAAGFGLARLLAVQYPNGAWPQRFEAPPDREQFPVLEASYPESWPRSWPQADYRGCYTFNDHAIDDVIDVMLEAGRVYDNPDYRAAALAAGDFILMAQMPDPQPAWAQQYDARMHPCWARKFEPPAVTGGESQGVMRTLMKLYRQTGQRKYLEPIPGAIAYLRSSLLPDGRLARFYELKTNRPLYCTRDYLLTYSDADTPTHYAFKVSSGLDSIEREYRRLADADAPPTPAPEPSWPGVSAGQVRAMIESLDEKGRWLEEGSIRTEGPNAPARQVIDCATFIRNVGILSAYLAGR